jgi:hypothetical protein
MTRTLILCFALVSAGVMRAQYPVPAPPTPLTEALLMAQRPSHFSEDQWRRIIRNPGNAGVYPIRITRSMLDTLDASELDKRYVYKLMPEPIVNCADGPK